MTKLETSPTKTVSDLISCRGPNDGLFLFCPPQIQTDTEREKEKRSEAGLCDTIESVYRVLLCANTTLFA